MVLVVAVVAVVETGLWITEGMLVMTRLGAVVTAVCLTVLGEAACRTGAAPWISEMLREITTIASRNENWLLKM